MNTNLLKKFAQEARKKLLEQVSAKLSFVLTTDSVELREKTEQLKQLREALTKTTKEQLIEKVAYTWFNRLMALRFMDANDYQPMGIRVITPKDSYTIPEILDEAKRGSIHEELKVNRQKVYDLLDNKIPSKNPQNEAFKELLIAACNQLHTTFPFLFEKINDFTELLIPDDLTSDFSVVTDVRNGMPVEDCKNVEIIGWLYQFYISEKKDEVFASKAKVKKEDIPAATQLFTPRWIVEYMVQNTLGKLWLQNRPKSKLREHMPYFIESASVAAEEYLKINSPEEIKFADPASGSGHILVYAFDLFTKIYEEEGYNMADIPKLIIEKNLYGFEIDERAAQLSGLALMMKAREYQRRAFKKDLEPNIICFQDLQLSNDEIKETLNTLKLKVSDNLIHDLLLMQQATNFGSLIIPHAEITEIHSVIDKLNQSAYSPDVFLKNRVDSLVNATIQLLTLSRKLHCVVANPPYMGDGNMNIFLSEYVKINYPNSKSDLMACFMDCGLSMLQNNGFLGMINQHSWMFLSSYETLRIKLIGDIFIDTLLHLGARTFPEIGGEVVQNASFTFWKKPLNEDGVYIRLVDYNKTDIKRNKTLDAIQNTNCAWYYLFNQRNFNSITGNPIGYWVSDSIMSLYKNQKLGNIYEFQGGVTTGNDELHLRQWYELDITNIEFNGNDEKCLYKSNKTWYPLNKIVGSIKWFSPFQYVINFKNRGESIVKSATRYNYRLKEPKYYFKKGISWSDVGSNKSAFRFQESGILFAARGPMIFSDDKYLLGYLNTKIVNHLLLISNPTLTFNLKEVRDIPFNIIGDDDSIIQLVDSSIGICNLAGNKDEFSSDFKFHEFIRINNHENIRIEDSFDLFIVFWRNKFLQLHKNEEELNLKFIQIYNLLGELTPDISLEDITLLQDELDRKSLAQLNSKLIRDLKTLTVTNYNEMSLPFIASEIMSQFISYSVGCMFGRYSLDKEGLILASQGETLQDYLQKIAKSKDDCNFLPDDDNIIPILDNEWFEDDVVGRFYKFLKVTFGEPNFNKNIAFIEEQIGMDMRKYFTKEFYPDHIKRYKKRPIYWMFSSPKGSFNALIYMHRYTPDTVSNILNKYLKEFSGKLRTRKEHLLHIQVSGSPSEKTKALKESDSIDKIIVELQEYERDILYTLATDRISIDLDDGVLVNYNKFGKAIKEVSGLNDKATKNKVREFDWIDTTQIK